MPLTETETYGKAKYSIDGTNWQDSNVLTEQSVAVFKGKDAAIPISFVKPEGLPESVIPAGTYSGTITFDITYSKTP